MVEAQGGDAGVVDDPARLPTARDRRLLRAPRRGYVASVDAERLGKASMLLGAGRSRAGDRLDHAAGLELLARPGTQVSAGDPLVALCYNDGARLEPALAVLAEAFELAEAPLPPRPLVLATIPPS
jgi:pyrimidine-nucleoside phosphorylase